MATMRTNRYLSLNLPFKSDRIIRILDLLPERKENILRKCQRLEPRWYIRMTQTYLAFSQHWGLCKLREGLYQRTELGDAALRLWEEGLEDTSTRLIYYGFVSSKSFSTLAIIVEALFRHLEEKGTFEITNEKLIEFIPVFKGRKTHDIPNLTKALESVGLLQGSRRKGFKTYEVGCRNLPLLDFALTLLWYAKTNRLLQGRPLNLYEFEKYRRYWFMAKENFENKLRLCRGKHWIVYQEYADLRQVILQKNFGEMLDIIVSEKSG